MKHNIALYNLIRHNNMLSQYTKIYQYVIYVRCYVRL